MSLRLVRCPFCGKRFNVTGIHSGTRLRCTGCTAILSVPAAEVARREAWRLTRSVAFQIAGGIAAGLMAALAIYVLLRPAPVPAPAAPAAARKVVRPAPAAPAPPEGPKSGSFGDPLSKARQAVIEEFGTDVAFYSTIKPYLLAAEFSERFIGAQLIEDYARRLETLHQAFRKEFAEPLRLPEVDEVLVVLILNSRESFDRYCEKRENRRMASHIKGIYEYNRRRVVIYHDFHAPYEVLFHEGIHQLVHYYTLRASEGRKVAATYWFQEGLGTYFEGFRRTGGDAFEFDPGSNRSRLPIVKQSLLQDAKDFISLNVLVGMTVDEFWGWFEGNRTEPHQAEDTTRMAQLYYAESWAFVTFLRQRGGNHQKTFEDYFKLELAGEGGKEAFERVLWSNLRMELPHLEQEFVEYVRNLR